MRMNYECKGSISGQYEFSAPETSYHPRRTRTVLGDPSLIRHVEDRHAINRECGETGFVDLW